MLLPVAMTSLACSARYGTRSEVLEMFPVWKSMVRMRELKAIDHVSISRAGLLNASTTKS